MDNNEKTSEKITKWLLVVISVLFLAIMLLLPLITVIIYWKRPADSSRPVSP